MADAGLSTPYMPQALPKIRQIATVRIANFPKTHSFYVHDRKTPYIRKTKNPAHRAGFSYNEMNT